MCFYILDEQNQLSGLSNNKTILFIICSSKATVFILVLNSACRQSDTYFGLVLFACISVSNKTWRLCVLHYLSVFFFFLPSTSVSFLLFPWPLSIPQILPYESVWLAVCCCQGACEGDSSRQTGPGSGRPAPTTGKEEILEDSTKATAALCLPTFIL